MASDDHAFDARMGIVALRAWFFRSVQTTQEPDNVISPFPSFPEVELLNEMDEPPPGTDAPPPGAMSIFDFYQSFTKDADLAEETEDLTVLGLTVLQRVMPAKSARSFLKLWPEHKTAPDINVGVRFLFHLAHALKTLTPPGVKRVEEDPCVVVNLPLDWSGLVHMFPPSVVEDPSETHKAAWANRETGTYNEMEFVSTLNATFHIVEAAHAAFPGVATLQVRCPLCECHSKIVEDMGEAVASVEAYTKTMAAFCCPRCGLFFSCLNPNIEVGVGGIKRREQ